MAAGQGFQTCREIFVGGRARALSNAIAYFENGRVGRSLNIRINNDNNERRVTGQEMGLPHGRAHTFNTLIPGLGGLSLWRGRGRGLSLPTPITPPSTPPQPLGTGFALPPHLIHLLPLKIVLHL